MSNSQPETRFCFEKWVQLVHPGHWPNPDSEGSRTFPSGGYRNTILNLMWEAWLARDWPGRDHESPDTGTQRLHQCWCGEYHIGRIRK